MDKNVAALLRNDAKTVGVRFFLQKDQEAYANSQRSKSLSLGTMPEEELSPETYTYVTNENFEPGDLAMVFVSQIPKVVRVTEVHPACQIEPDSSMQYKWIAAKIDLGSYLLNMSKNAEIEDVIAKSYKRSLKSQFKSLMLADVAPEDQQLLLAALGETK